MIKQFSIFILAMIMTLALFSQSRTVQNFIETADGYNLYLYQSLIRVLNQDENPDFNMLIRDLDHLRFLSTDSIGTTAKATFSDLDKGIQGEGFESIMSFDNKDYKCHIYELEDRSGQSSWVATLFIEGRAGLIEMKGSVDMKYLHAFSSLNMDKLKDVLPIEELKDN
ncbi:MAG: DUF4252 domain-containing protein [Bacteroidota bacterium]